MPPVELSSSEEALTANLRLVGPNQLGSHLAPTELSEEHDLAAVFHESALNNLPFDFLNDEQGLVTDRSVAKAFSVLNGKTPSPLRVYEGSEPWKLELKKPAITFTFNKDEIVIELGILRLIRENRKVAGPFTMTAKYQPSVGRFGPVWIREEKIGCRGPKNSLKEDRAFLYSKLDSFFATELDFAGLILPAGGSLDNFSKLRLTRIYSEKGFLGFGYNYINPDLEPEPLPPQEGFRVKSMAVVAPLPSPPQLPIGMAPQQVELARYLENDPEGRVLRVEWKRKFKDLRVGHLALLLAVREINGRSIKGTFNPELCHAASTRDVETEVLQSESYPDSGESLMRHARACVREWLSRPADALSIRSYQEEFCFSMEDRSDNSCSCRAVFYNEEPQRRG